MDDLISRQAAIDALEGEIAVTGRANAEAVLGYANLICDRIKRLPSADAVEIRHGRWIDKDCGIATCSVCGGEPYYSGNIYAYKYCPYCGARMNGDNNDGA